jgi:stage II sporulation protein R
MRRKAALVVLIGVVLTGLIVTSAWVLAARERAGKTYNHENLIRLHIIANSNDPGDQELKYHVRDAIISAFRPELLKVRSRTEAEALLASDQGKIASIAERVVADNGRRYPARVEIGDFDFPTRTYGDLVLPAGNYRAVRVVLGQGAGANWWCVLFPPLCFVDAAGAGIRAPSGRAALKDSGAALANGPWQSPLGQQEINPVVGGSVRLRLRALEWLENETGYMARVFSS